MKVDPLQTGITSTWPEHTTQILCACIERLQDVTVENRRGTPSGGPMEVRFAGWGEQHGACDPESGHNRRGSRRGAFPFTRCTRGVGRSQGAPPAAELGVTSSCLPSTKARKVYPSLPEMESLPEWVVGHGREDHAFSGLGKDRPRYCRLFAFGWDWSRSERSVPQGDSMPWTLCPRALLSTFYVNAITVVVWDRAGVWVVGSKTHKLFKRGEYASWYPGFISPRRVSSKATILPTSLDTKWWVCTFSRDVQEKSCLSHIPLRELPSS